MYYLPISQDIGERLVNLLRDVEAEINKVLVEALDNVLTRLEQEYVYDEDAPLDDETIELLRQRIAEEDKGGPLITLEEMDERIRTALAASAEQRKYHVNKFAS